MGSIWAEGTHGSLEQALDLLAASLRDCTDALWELPMWPVEPLERDHQFIGTDGNLISDPAQRMILARRWLKRRSTPWSVAWHALECFDYDLGGDFAPWAPPPPFSGHPHWRDLPNLPAAWSRGELLGYIDYCRGRAGSVVAELTEKQAARPLPRTHRHAGQPYGSLLVGLGPHTTEHAAQIRHFITGAAATGDR